MRISVIGGGFGGLASAARLAKLGHEVTLFEAGPHLGGAVSRIEHEGFSWDAGPTTTLLPAVIRDLFRKSGRPLERELDLVPLDVVREHRFADDTSVVLRGGSRGVQHEAFEQLGRGLGDAWCDHVAAYADDWELVRKEYLERPWRPELADKAVVARLFTRETLAKRLQRDFRDKRLQLVAGYPHEFAGHDLRNVPAWLGVQSYVEQNFGNWTVPGGIAGLSTALSERLETRRVTVHLDTRVRDLVVREGRVVAVALDGPDGGEHDADAVVCAVDPRSIPALAERVRRTMPAIPPFTVHLGLSGDVPELGPETVLHGDRKNDPTVTVRTGGSAPEGGTAVTLHARGHLAEDLVLALARYDLDLRPYIETRVDRSAREQVTALGGSAMGVLWQGRDTLKQKLGPTTPIPGVYAAGAHAVPGYGLPFVGLSASLVAQEIGPA